MSLLCLGCLLLHDELLLLEHLRQVAVLVHRNKNVATTNKVLLHVELGNGWPVGVLLDSLTQLLVLEDVEGSELFGVDALNTEDLDGGAGEAALWCFGSSLHEEHNGSGGDGFVDGGAGLVGEKTQLLSEDGAAGGLERSEGSAGGRARSLPKKGLVKEESVSISIKPWRVDARAARTDAKVLEAMVVIAMRRMR